MSPLHDPREKTFEEVSGSLANAEAFTYSGNVQRTKVHRHTVEQLTFVVEASERPGARSSALARLWGGDLLEGPTTGGRFESASPLQPKTEPPNVPHRRSRVPCRSSRNP